MRLQRLDKLHNEKSATQESSSSAWYACRFVPKLLVTPIVQSRSGAMSMNGYRTSISISSSSEIIPWVEIGYDSGGIFDNIRIKPEDTLAAIDADHTTGLYVYLRICPEWFNQDYWEKPGEISPYDNHGLETDLLTGEMMPGVGQREPVADVTGFLDGVYFWHGRHNP
jgi:hypothetical protein